MKINKLNDSQKKDSRIRSITATFLVAVIIPTTLFGNYFFFALIVFLSFFAVKELLEVPGPFKYNLPTKLVVYFFTFSFIFWTFIKSHFQTNQMLRSVISFPTLFVSILAIMLYALILFFIAIIDKKIQLNDVTYLFTMGLIVALGFQGILFLRFYPNCDGLMIFQDTKISLNIKGQELHTTYGRYFIDYYDKVVGAKYQSMASCVLIAYTLTGVWMADVGAYLFGMLFGKHRMNPRISPHKTWEGFFGGVLVSMVFSIAVAAIMEFCFNLPLIPGVLQLAKSPLLESLHVLHGNSWIIILLLSFIMPTVGALGGLIFSLIKRTYGIKDFGKIFPGHGGVIDRFDSVLISSIAMAIIIQLTASGWSFLV